MAAFSFGPVSIKTPSSSGAIKVNLATLNIANNRMLKRGRRFHAAPLKAEAFPRGGHRSPRRFASSLVDE